MEERPRVAHFSVAMIDSVEKNAVGGRKLNVVRLGDNDVKDISLAEHKSNRNGADAVYHQDEHTTILILLTSSYNQTRSRVLLHILLRESRTASLKNNVTGTYPKV